MSSLKEGAGKTGGWWTQPPEECKYLQDEMWEGKEDKHKDVHSYVVASTHLIFVQHSISYLAVIFGTSELKWFSFPQQIAIHRGSFDIGVCCTRWKTSFWLYWFWLNQLCLSTVKVLKVVFSPALFSHLQHALPRSLPAGSRWHHVTDHQHAGNAVALALEHTCPLNIGLGWYIYCPISNF